MQEPWPLYVWPNARTRHLLCRDDRFFPADLPEGSPGNAWASPPTRSRVATPGPSAARKNLLTASRRAGRSGRSQPASGFAREQQHQLPLRRPTWFPLRQVRCCPTARSRSIGARSIQIDTSRWCLSAGLRKRPAPSMRLCGLRAISTGRRRSRPPDCGPKSLTTSWPAPSPTRWSAGSRSRRDPSTR
jgi:hypothetical protein